MEYEEVKEDREEQEELEGGGEGRKDLERSIDFLESLFTQNHLSALG